MREVLKLCKFLYFDKPKYRLRSTIKMDGLDQLQKDIINEVNLSGFYILDNYFPDAVVSSLREAASEKEAIISGTDFHLSFPSFGVDRYLRLDNFKEFAAFFNGYFDHIGRNYLGGLGVRYQSMYERKGAPAMKSSADVPHFDDWKKRFKIFLYLNDVTDNNCPLIVYKNSNQDSAYLGRKYKEIEYVLGGKASAYGHLCENEEKLLLSNTKIEEIKIIGKAGTVIFVDTRMIHKGTPSVDGSQRHLLASYYDIR